MSFSSKMPLKLFLAGCVWVRFFTGRFYLWNFPTLQKNRFLGAILGNVCLRVCLRNCQANLGLGAARFRVLHTLRSTKSVAASYDLNVVSSSGAPTHPWLFGVACRVTCAIFVFLVFKGVSRFGFQLRQQLRHPRGVKLLLLIKLLIKLRIN